MYSKWTFVSKFTSSNRILWALLSQLVKKKIVVFNKLQATLEGCNDLLAHSLTGVKCRATSVAKKLEDALARNYDQPVNSLASKMWLKVGFNWPICFSATVKREKLTKRITLVMALRLPFWLIRYLKPKRQHAQSFNFFQFLSKNLEMKKGKQVKFMLVYIRCWKL